MAFATVAAEVTGSRGTDATSHTVTLPSGIVSGSLLTVEFASDATSSTTASWPAGWTELVDARSSADNTLLALAYRFADGTEGASITVTTADSQQMAYASKRWTDHHASAAPEASATSTGGAGTSPDSSSLSPSWGAEDSVYVSATSYNSASTTVSTYPTNYANGVNPVGGSGVSGAALASARRELNAASDNPGAYTLSATPAWIAVTWVVRPAATAIAADRDLVYTIIQAITADRDLVYSIRNSVLSDRDLVYNILNAVLADRDLVYTIRHSVLSDRDLVYTIVQAVTADRDLVYTIVQAIGSDRDLVYSIRNSVAADRDLVYSIRHSVLADRDLVYSIIQAVLSDRALVYDIGDDPAADVLKEWFRRRRLYQPDVFTLDD